MRGQHDILVTTTQVSDETFVSCSLDIQRLVTDQMAREFAERVMQRFGGTIQERAMPWTHCREYQLKLAVVDPGRYTRLLQAEQELADARYELQQLKAQLRELSE